MDSPKLIEPETPYSLPAGNPFVLVNTALGSMVLLSDGRLAMVGYGDGFPVLVQIVNADFSVTAPALDATGASASGTTSYGMPRIAALPAGGYAVSWVATDATTNPATKTLAGELFAGDGTPVVALSPTPTNAARTILTALADGSLLYSVYDFRFQPTVQKSDIVYHFSASGALLGSATLTTEATGLSLSGFQGVVALTGGGIVATELIYTRNSDFTFDYDLLVRMLDQNLTQQHQLLAFDGSGGLSHALGESSIKALPDGGFVVEYGDRVFDPSTSVTTYEIHAAFYDADGTERADVLLASAPGYGLASPQLGILSNGTVVAVWEDDKGGVGLSSWHIYGQLLDPQGELIGARFTVADAAVVSGTSGTVHPVGVVGLDHGKFVVNFIDAGPNEFPGAAVRAVYDASASSLTIGADKGYVSRGGITIPGAAAAAALLANDSGFGPLTIQSVSNVTGGSATIGGDGNLAVSASTVASVTTGGFDYTVADSYGMDSAHVTLGFVTTSSGNDTVSVPTLAGEFSFVDAMAGIDKVTGGAGKDTFWGGAGNDTLVGGAGTDTLYGGADGDRLDGGTGADTMFGGAGNDTYIVDDVGDVVREDTVAGMDDGGTLDIVEASVSFTLGAFIERLTLTGSAASDGTGNDQANVITGNAGANHLYGMGGNDILIANGNGADYLDGGEGSDTYNVDNADTVHDSGTTGTDTIISSGGYTLAEGSGIENLQLKAGTTNTATLTGESGANKLIGNDGDNLLRGMAGNDILQGGLGNDRLQGGTGRDTLTGGDGNDIFIFNAGDTPSTASPLAYDTVNDFATGIDKIDLDVIGGAGLVASAYAEVAIASNAFSAVLAAATSAMADGQHTVAFVATNTDGWLLWNTDADKHTAEQAVRLVGQNSLAAFDRTDVM